MVYRILQLKRCFSCWTRFDRLINETLHDRCEQESGDLKAWSTPVTIHREKDAYDMCIQAAPRNTSELLGT